MMEFYAELSKKDYQDILDGKVTICVPEGVTMKNMAGSRALFFECDDEDIVKLLVEGLEASGVSWQGND